MKLIGKLVNLQGKISKSFFELRQPFKDEPFFDIVDITHDNVDAGYAEIKIHPESKEQYFDLHIYQKDCLGKVVKEESAIYVYVNE